MVDANKKPTDIFLGSKLVEIEESKKWKILFFHGEDWKEKEMVLKKAIMLSLEEEVKKIWKEAKAQPLNCWEERKGEVFKSFFLNICATYLFKLVRLSNIYRSGISNEGTI